MLFFVSVVSDSNSTFFPGTVLNFELISNFEVDPNIGFDVNPALGSGISSLICLESERTEIINVYDNLN